MCSQNHLFSFQLPLVIFFCLYIKLVTKKYIHSFCRSREGKKTAKSLLTLLKDQYLKKEKQYKATHPKPRVVRNLGTARFNGKVADR